MWSHVSTLWSQIIGIIQNPISLQFPIISSVSCSSSSVDGCLCSYSLEVQGLSLWRVRALELPYHTDCFPSSGRNTTLLNLVIKWEGLILTSSAVIIAEVHSFSHCCFHPLLSYRFNRSCSTDFENVFGGHAQKEEEEEAQQSQMAY